MLVAALLVAPAIAQAQATADTTPSSAASAPLSALEAIDAALLNRLPPADPHRKALIICGLTGDVAQRERFLKTVPDLQRGLVRQCGFAPESIEILWGDAPRENDPALIRAAERATRPAIEAAAQRLANHSSSAAWVFVLGHMHFDGQTSHLNIPGPDLPSHDFGKLFDQCASPEQVFWITTSASGQWIAGLSRPGRVVISATEADWETNATDFPHLLANLLTTPPTLAEIDDNHDQQVSLLEVYEVLTRMVATSYADGEFLATEHAQLDDNGDRRGTELQIDWLLVDLGGRVVPNRPRGTFVPKTGDGLLAQRILIPLRPSPPEAVASPEPVASPEDTPAPESTPSESTAPATTPEPTTPEKAPADEAGAAEPPADGALSP